MLNPMHCLGPRKGDFYTGINFDPGDYTLEVTAFSRRSGNGIAFAKKSYNFTLSDWSDCKDETFGCTSGDGVMGIASDLGIGTNSTGSFDPITGSQTIATGLAVKEPSPPVLNTNTSGLSTSSKNSPSSMGSSDQMTGEPLTP